ncbi:vacuolar sorting protein 39 [Dendrobium catenatum]|uniref:vacuolar sorting protein 39 n=1 Tax=Dendrobium catenatum TaxID=906689 RepID=UPI0010A01EAC|nr:vacuolar sorting protein 39 [Dendrobium catenatum]
MVHSAYDLVELVKGCNAKVESLATYGSKILLGCSDGSLRIFVPTSALSIASSPSSGDEGLQPSDSDIKREPYALERAMSGFWKRAPLAMEVCRSRDLLLSLSEWIAFHRLPNLETVVAIAKTKGANVYSWDDRRGFLCVGRQKRVGIYRLDGGREFVEVKEFGVSDQVKSMAWCGENICLGIGKEYIILNSTTGASSKVFSSGRSIPLVVPLPSGELILGKDDVGVFVDQNGKLLQDGRICWSEAPSSIVIHKPYGLARLPRHVEIRSLDAPYPLVQTIVLRDVHLLQQSNNCAIAAVGSSIYGLLPVPVGAQIVQLTASGNFVGALALCKLLPPEDSSLRAAKEASIHIRYGHYLFDNGSYEESMDQFLASQVDITYVLSLYPSITLPKDLTIVEPEKFQEQTDAFYLSRFSSDVSDDMESSLPSQFYESDDKSAVEDKKTSYNAIMALAKYLQRKRFSVIERATAEVTEEVVSDAVQGSITTSEPYGSMSSSKKRGHPHISSVGRELATILDTALIQALLLTGQFLVAVDLVKGPNYCDLKICEEILKGRNDYEVLLELYKYNGMHHEALKLLHQLIEESNSSITSSESQNFKPSMIINYLKPLCTTDPMLVLEYSTLVLEKCPTETMELFLWGNVPADLVNSYLKKHAPNLQSTYLELMLSMSGNGINTNLQSELVQIYLSEVIDWYKDLKEKHNWDEKIYSSTRTKLLSLLDSMPSYNTDALLKRLPSDALYEERAVLLGKINQHQLALSLYIHKLYLPDQALTYCDRVYEMGPQQPSKFNSNIYLTLLQIYLNPQRSIKEFEQKTYPVPLQKSSFQKITKGKGGRVTKKIAEIEGAEDMRISPSSTDSGRSDVDGEEANEEGGPIMLNEALDLLSQRWDKINGAQALKLLPRDTKLQNLRSFLEPLLRKSSEGRRNYCVIKSLRYSENLQVKEELYKHRRTVVKIDGDSTCALCHKKIGTSVFAVYPNGKTLVHFVCFRDSQTIKTVRGSGTPKLK